MKLCKDCTWIRYNKHPDSLVFSKFCASPMYEKKTDLVEGAVKMKECCDMRSDSRLCGESGVFYNPK